MVHGAAVTLETMVVQAEGTYSTRLAKAMALAGADVHSVAKALGISYTAVKKVLDGKTNALTAENNSRAARFLRIDTDWLAAGVGAPNFGAARAPAAGTLPFSDLNPFEAQAITLFRQLPADVQHEVLVAMNKMLPQSGEASASDPFKERRGNPDRRRGNVRGNSIFGEFEEDARAQPAQERRAAKK